SSLPEYRSTTVVAVKRSSTCAVDELNSRSRRASSCVPTGTSPCRGVVCGGVPALFGPPGATGRCAPAGGGGGVGGGGGGAGFAARVASPRASARRPSIFDRTSL